MVKHNGVDDSANIMDALEKCKDGGRVVFQKERNYMLGDVIVSPELQNVEIIFDGTLTYPYDMYVNDGSLFIRSFGSFINKGNTMTPLLLYLVLCRI